MLYTAQESSNPMSSGLAAPTWWWFVILVIALTLALAIAALVSIARSHQLRRIESVALAVWVLVVLAFPFAGSVVWFLVGRRSSLASHEESHSAARTATRDGS